MGRLWDEYCSNASIHGIRFATSDKRTLLERGIWLGTLVFSACCIVSQVWTNWEYYKSYPMQVTETSSNLLLSHFDFPAITICSVYKVKYSRALSHIRRVLGNNASEDVFNSYWDTITAIALLHYPHYDFPLEYAQHENITPYFLDSEDIPLIMREVGHHIDDMLERCKWKGSGISCKKLFKLQRTEEGFCHSFNSRTSEEESENVTFSKQDENTQEKTEIHRNSGAGKHTGLELWFKDPDKKFHRKFQQLSKGYTIIVHNKNDQPDNSVNFMISEQHAKVQRIYITPYKYYSDDSVKKVPPLIRGCYWWDEVSDKNVYKIIEKGRCLVDCKLNMTVRQCGCMPYFFQAPPGTKYCNIEHMECLAFLNKKLRNYELVEVEDREEGTEGDEGGQLICNCIKPCSYVAYNSELSIATINIPHNIHQYAYVDISYKQRHGKCYLREVKFTFKDLTVTIGGYAGLLLGCSLISILEIGYYLIRMLYNTGKKLVKQIKNLSYSLDEPQQKKTEENKNLAFVQPSLDYPFVH